MKIGIILHPYGEKNPAGLAEYIYSLAESLVTEDKENQYLIYIKGKASKLPKFAMERCQVYKLGFGPLWRDLGLFLAPKADIYLFNTPVLPLLWRPKRSLVIALDFAYYFLQSKNFRAKLNRWLLFWLNGISLRRAKQIVTISNATKSDVIGLFKIPEEKIKTIYPGFRSYGKQAVISQKFLIYKPFFLFVGVIKDRKNVLNIVKAFISFKHESNLPHKLIVAGKGGGEYLELLKKTVREAKLEEEVIFVGRVSEDELSELYETAEALVFPSLFEGFGFPLLEAMSANLPVITSNRGALAEVAGNAALKINPESVSEITMTMKKIANDDKIASTLRVAGLERIKDFSWSKNVTEFQELFKHL